MHGYYSEDVAFERLQDLQREAENRRLTAASPRDLAHMIGTWVARVRNRRPARARLAG
ncbi:MAG: hypothetical protein NVS1B3_01920 [Candidatus Dormibacteraceae bacterium]